MTNQQAPEALHPIARYKIGYAADSWGMRSSTPSGIPDHAGAWVRYEDHVAALVEAQQPDAHVQNPAEIAHVAGDVSKNGAESNMAQRPAPSAAAALPEGWVPLVITHEGQYPEEVAYGPQILMDRLGKWLRKYFDHVVASKAQPSPTPQADSTPVAICNACGAELLEVKQSPNSYLSAEQFDADKLGDWYCKCCPKGPSEGSSTHRYFWNRDLGASAPQADSQPAPSAAAASKAVLAAIRAANMQLVRTGDDEFMLVTFKQATPQADSQPAPVLDERAAFAEHWQKNDGRPPITWEALFAQQGTETPTHCAGRYFLRETQTAWEAWQARAARAPADSVTAPVGVTVAVGSQEFDLADTGARFTTADMATACGQAFREGRATPPAQAANSVLEDAARLDWLGRAGPTSICVVIDRPHDSEIEVATDDVTGYGKTLREALDAARKQEANHDHT